MAAARSGPDGHSINTAEQAAQTECQPESKSDIERNEVPHRSNPAAADGQQKGALSASSAVQPECAEIDGNADPQTINCRNQSRTEFALPQNLEGGGCQPVVQRRLFEILQAIQARRHKVVADRHFAADLGITSFVRGEQRPKPQTPEPYDGDQRTNQEPDRRRKCLIFGR